ncbi:MAG: hypothetical protein HYU66_00855 [Armatimonadetes bacterium]|nr:hypothetical protein [Armatimonadota bacterium]
MADVLERALERLRQGEDPGWRGWNRLRDAHTAAVYQALASALAERRPAKMTRRALDILEDACRWGHLDLVAQPAILSFVVRGMVQESWHDAPVAGTGQDVWRHRDVFHRFECYHDILRKAGAATLPLATAVLAGPPLPAGVLHDFQFTRSVQCGAKPVALEVVRLWGGADELPLLRALLADGGEPLLTRVLAAFLLYHMSGPGEMPLVIQHLLEPVLHGSGSGLRFGDGMDFLWPTVVPQLVAALADPDYGVRDRADRLVRRAGAAAIPALAELVRLDSDWRTLEHARGLLEELDPEVLAQAERERETMGRSLSLVDDSPGDRSLSPAEPRDET